MIMDSLIIMLGSIVFLGAGYFFYARKIEKFLEVNPDNITPANKYYDGVDYVPARNWLVLFSHHFASIAGAGPIVGPVIAVAIWGWLPALAWIIIGTIFMGGVHDFAAIVISVRYKARSIADIAEDVVLGAEGDLLGGNLHLLSLISCRTPNTAVFAQYTSPAHHMSDRLTIAAEGYANAGTPPRGPIPAY